MYAHSRMYSKYLEKIYLPRGGGFSKSDVSQIVDDQEGVRWGWRQKKVTNDYII